MGESVSTESQPPKLCSWILFPYGLAVKRKSGSRFFVRNPLFWANLRGEDFCCQNREAGQKVHFLPEEISLISTKSALCRNGRSAPQIQSSERILLRAAISASPECPQTAEKNAGNERETEQYPDESKRVYYEIADVVLVAGNVLVEGHNSLVFDQCEQPFRRVGIWWI